MAPSFSSFDNAVCVYLAQTKQERFQGLVLCCVCAAPPVSLSLSPFYFEDDDVRGLVCVRSHAAPLRSERGKRSFFFYWESSARGKHPSLFCFPPPLETAVLVQNPAFKEEITGKIFGVSWISGGCASSTKGALGTHSQDGLMGLKSPHTLSPYSPSLSFLDLCVDHVFFLQYVCVCVSVYVSFYRSDLSLSL